MNGSGGHVSTLLRRAGLLVDLDRLDEASDLLRGALTGDPNDVGLLTALADVSARAGDVATAHRAALAAIENDPTGAGPARFVLGAVYLVAGMVDDATAVARGLVEQSPNNADAQALLATCLARDALLGHKRRDALAVIDRALALAPHDPDLHLRLARAAGRMNEQTRAGQIARAGLRADPTNPDLREIAAGAAVLTGDRARMLTEVLETDPTRRLARHALAATVWGTLGRLASGVWIYALALILLSAWIAPDTIRHVVPVLMAPLIAHWIRLFVRLRRRLPKGYLRKRLWRNPTAVCGLVLAAAAALLANLAPVLIAVAWDSDGVRAGYWALIVACALAGLAHVLVTLGGVRRDADIDPRVHLDERDGYWLVWLLGMGVPIGVCWALHGLAAQPGALWYALMLPPIVLAARAVEWALIRTLRVPGTARSRVGVVVVAALFVVGCGWLVSRFGHEAIVADFAYTVGPLSPGQFVAPTPTVPTFTVPTFTPIPPLQLPTPQLPAP